MLINELGGVALVGENDGFFGRERQEQFFQALNAIAAVAFYLPSGDA